MQDRILRRTVRCFVSGRMAYAQWCRTIVFAAAVLTANVVNPGAAQTKAEYPTKPVRYLIPFAIGGTNDVVGRIVAQKLSERFGQQVIADNRRVRDYFGSKRASGAAAIDRKSVV